MSVAVTILEQLTQSKNPMNRLSVMTGAGNFASHGDEGVSFKFKGSRKANFCKVILNSMDTYTVTFGKIRKYELTKVQTFEGVYNDALKDLFEDVTGLYLSL